MVLLALLVAVAVPRPGAASPPFKAPPRRAAAQAAASAQAAAPAQVERVRYQADDHSTRVIVMLSRSVPFEVRVLPGEASRGSECRVVLDFSNAKLAAEALAPIGVEDGLLKQIRTGQFTARTARVVLDLASVTSHEVSQLDDPPRVVVDIAGRAQPATAATSAHDAADSAIVAPAATAPETPGADTARATDTAARNATRGDDGNRQHDGGTLAMGAAPPAATPPSEPATRDAASTRGSRQARLSRAREEAASVRASRARPDTTTERSSRERQETASTEPPHGRDESATTERSARGREETERAPTPREETATAESPRASPPPTRATPWRIVLDPGHGGNDPGTLGIDGVYEKDVTLKIAKHLKRRLEEGLGAQVLLTRDRDATRTLAQRTAFANASNADLFVSIHANADAAGELHGIETYTLNNTNDRAAIRLAKMENGPGVRTGRGDLSFILSDMVQSGKEEESIALANRLQQHLVSRLRSRYPDVRSLGVKKGPFYVLVGAYMPCVLVETSFLSHPIEGRRLASPDYQAEVVEGLYLGMADFLGDQRLAKTL